MISKKTVKTIADLIKIHIEDEELDAFATQLETALEPADVLNELDTQNIKETSQTIGTKNIYRDDTIDSSLSQSEALLNTTNSQNGYIVVTRVIK